MARILRHRDLRSVQRIAGNQAVQRLLQRAPAPETSPPTEAPAAEAKASSQSAVSSAQAVLRAVPPLPPGDVARLGELMGQAPLYALIHQRDEKRSRLVELSIVSPENAPPATADLLTQLGKEVQQLDAQIKAALPTYGVTDEKQLRHRIEDEFPEIWIARATQIANTILDRAHATAEAEQRRYGGSEGQAPDDVRELKVADQHLAELMLELQSDPAFAELTRLEPPRAESAGDGAGGAPNRGGDGSDVSVRVEATEKAWGRRFQLRAALRPKYDKLRGQTQRYGARFPILLASQYKPGAFQTMNDADAKKTAATWSEETLAKIERTRGRLGDSIKLWDLPRISAMTYQSLGVPESSPLALGLKHKSGKVKSDDGLLTDALSVLSVGLGAAALVAGGPAGIALGAAAAVAGVGASLSQLIQDLEHYFAQSDAEALGMDPELREIFMSGPPDLQALVLDIAGLGLALSAAAVSAKHLIGAVRKARALAAGGAAARELAAARAELANAIAQNPHPLPADAADRLVMRAEDPVQAVRSAEATGEGIAKAVRASAAGTTFAERIHESQKLLGYVRGRIPDFARSWIAQGRIRELTAESLIRDFGAAQAQQLIGAGWLKKRGVFSPVTQRIYVVAQSPEQLAGTIIHEATHALEHQAQVMRLFDHGSGMGLNEARNEVLSNLLDPKTTLDAETKAFMAQRDFYILLFAEEGGALNGYENLASERTRLLLSWKDNDAALVDWVQKTYKVKTFENPMFQEMYAEEIAEALFQDIATHVENVPTL